MKPTLEGKYDNLSQLRLYNYANPKLMNWAFVHITIVQIYFILWNE